MVTRLMVLQVLGDSAFGGATGVVLEQCRMLQGKGMEVTLLSTDAPTKAEFNRHGIPVVGPAVILRDVHPWRDVKALVALTRFLRRNRFDVVHTHTSKPGFIGRVAARLAGVSVIMHTVHLYAFGKGKSGPAEWLYAGLERLAGRWTDRVIVVSRENERLTQERRIIDREKCVFVANGVDWRKFRVGESVRMEERAELGVGPEEPVVGMVGRIAEQKDPLCFVEAAAALKERWPRARFLMVGDGPLRGDVEELAARRGLTDRFIMTGFRQDVAEILSAIDVYVVSSLWEGMSISLLEAMAAGRAIVATDIESNREVAEDGKTAILTPPGDPKALAEAIERFLDHPDLAADFGLAAGRAAADKFSMEQMIEATWHVYEAAAREKHLGQAREAMTGELHAR